MSTPDPAKGQAFHHGDLRRALIEATTDLIERDGPAAVSLREAARIAGVSHNAPYRHFPTRDALLAAVAAHGFDELKAAFDVPAVAAVDDRLLALGEAYLHFAQTKPGLFKLMFGSGLDRKAHPDLDRAAQAAYAVLLGASGPQGQASREGALGAWAMVHGLAHLIVDDQLAPDLREDARQAVLLGKISKAYGRVRGGY